MESVVLTASVAGPEARTRRFHIPSLDGIRAASFLIVFIGHTLGGVPGGFGVTVFFFLSGFLITTLLRMEYDESRTISLKRFYLRRILRIFPPFYLILMGSALLAASGALPYGIRLVPTLAQACHISNFYILAHGYDGQAAGTGVYWSLAVEEHFYLGFPICYYLLRRHLPEPWKQALVLAAVCALVLVWRCFLVFVLLSPTNRTYMATDTRLDSILFGCILAIYGSPALDPTRVSDRAWKAVWLPLGLLVLVFTFRYQAGWFRETVRYTMQGIALVPVFVAAVRFPTWAPFRPLNYAAVRFLGLMSYSMYLMHQVLIYLLWYRLPFLKPVRFVVVYALAAALAALMYHAVEKPCARLRRRLHARA